MNSIRPEEPFERMTTDDLAQHRAEELNRHALARVRAAVPPGGQPGWCSNCAAMLPMPLVYCDADCREDHEDRMHRALLGGGCP